MPRWFVIRPILLVSWMKALIFIWALHLGHWSGASSKTLSIQEAQEREGGAGCSFSLIERICTDSFLARRVLAEYWPKYLTHCSHSCLAVASAKADIWNTLRELSEQLERVKLTMLSYVAGIFGVLHTGVVEYCSVTSSSSIQLLSVNKISKRSPTIDCSGSSFATR